MISRFIPFLAGCLFALGLVIGGMTLPAKVVGFLDLFGDWDPSLIFVMGGAIAVYMPVYRIVRNRERPWASEKFHIPTRKDIDTQLVLGAVLFGLGWGLGGFCPGPVLASAGSGALEPLLVLGGMFAGMLAVNAMSPRTHSAP